MIHAFRKGLIASGELEEKMEARRFVVSGLFALQSTNTGGINGLSEFVRALFSELTSDRICRYSCTSGSALSGGTMLSSHFASRTIVANEASSMPDSCARCRVHSDRPDRLDNTRQPEALRRFATAAPIAPGEIIPMTGGLSMIVQTKYKEKKAMQMLGLSICNNLNKLLPRDESLFCMAAFSALPRPLIYRSHARRISRRQ